jgi:hypothetical protein
MENLQEQQLSLQLCIIAGMQREELSDSRNRQAAGNDRHQNEGQIWQRCMYTRKVKAKESSLEGANMSQSGNQWLAEQGRWVPR